MSKRRCQKGTKEGAMYAHLAIVESVAQKGKVPDYWPKRTRQRYINFLVEKGYISKISYGKWRIKDRAKAAELLQKEGAKKRGDTHIPPLKRKGHTPPSKKPKIRGHGFIFRYGFKTPKKWERRQEFLKKQGLSFKERGDRGQEIFIDGIRCCLYNQSIVMYSAPGMGWVAASAWHSRRLAAHDFQGVIEALEKMLKIRLKGRLDVRKEHYAKVSDELAKLYRQKRRKLQVRDEEGELRILADHSFNLDELETVKAGKAEKDMDEVVVPFWQSLLRNPDFTADYAMQAINGLTVNQAAITQNWQAYAEQIKAHVEAIKELGKAGKRQADMAEKQAKILEKLERRLADF